MYDVAFTVMDLEARQRKDLGNAFLNAYIEQTGALGRFTSAAFIFKSSGLCQGEGDIIFARRSGVPAAVKEEATKTASEYYKQAWEYTKPKVGELILMSGLSGSGKSTTARHLARQQGAIHLRSDAVRKHLGGISLWKKVVMICIHLR